MKPARPHFQFGGLRYRNNDFTQLNQLDSMQGDIEMTETRAPIYTLRLITEKEGKACLDHCIEDLPTELFTANGRHRPIVLLNEFESTDLQLLTRC